MRKYFRVGRVRIFGGSLFVHWSTLSVIGLLMLVSWRAPMQTGLLIVSYLAILLIHEAGHAAVASMLNCKVRTIKIALLHGSCEFENPHGEWEHVLISWGGVAAQFFVAFIVFLLAAIFDGQAARPFAIVVVFLGYINFAIAVVNLAPTLGLDGEKAWRLFPLLIERRSAKAMSGATKTSKNARRIK